MTSVADPTFRRTACIARKPTGRSAEPPHTPPDVQMVIAGVVGLNWAPHRTLRLLVGVQAMGGFPNHRPGRSTTLSSRPSLCL